MKRHIYRINEIKIKLGAGWDEIPRSVEKKVGIKRGTLDHRVRRSSELETGSYMIRRESIDARDKSDIKLVYTVDFELVEPLVQAKMRKAGIVPVDLKEPDVPEAGAEKMIGRPVIAGFGPCGIFAALELAKRGYRPLVIERGSSMEKRIKDVELFKEKAILDTESNVLFGEGGAGTFSDGKLTSGIRDDNIRYVLETFVAAGADEDILYMHRPHIGTDVLRRVIVELRKEIERLGGTILFDTCLDSIIIEDNSLKAIKVVGKSSSESAYEIKTNALILAIGHSARDTFEMLKDMGIKMEQKPFSIGVRIEHPQEMIDIAQYGEEAAKSGMLPPADYKVSYKASNGRGVYSFCMCPGGEVIVCSTAEGYLCVNGMSNRDRASGTANSGILCDVKCSDFGSDDVLAGVRFQEKYERAAFINGGGKYKAPSCYMAEFLGMSEGSKAVVDSMPDFAVDAIREAIPYFGRKIKGYDRDDAVVTAVETRSSSPVRILRNQASDEQAMESNVSGIYPAGEGAGYAGGITSAACDGIKAANAVIGRFSNDLDQLIAKK